jgi:heme A synthase
MLFMLGEAGIGASLVKLELVAHNASLARALYLSAHLLNTFLLLGSLALTAWWASGGLPVQFQGRTARVWLLGIGILGTLLVGMTGAITALGDTLFPAGSLLEGLRQDTSGTAHLLVRLRVLHPVLAIGTGLYLLALAASFAARGQGPTVTGLARGLGTLVAAQWVAGLANVALLAPVWLQLTHLLLADLVWIVLVLLGAAVLAQPATSRVAVAETPLDRAAPAGVRPGAGARR